MQNELQKELIHQFNRLHGDLTLKQISQITDIQITRVFRIFNGHEMKLSEYLVFIKAIESKLGVPVPLFDQLNKCLNNLNNGQILDVTSYINDKVKTSKLISIKE